MKLTILILNEFFHQAEEYEIIFIYFYGMK
jgi:hypothetical protein